MKTKYKKIYEDMREKIETGQYQVGDQLPDEMSVCRQYSCSRMTVKKAYDMLVMEGYIYRKQGQGSFVQLRSLKHKPEFKLEERELLGFTRASKGKGQSKILHFGLMFATPEIAKHLNIRVNDPVYDICRVRMIEDRPYVIEQTYISPNVIPGITKSVLQGSIYDYIETTLGSRIGASQRTTFADVSTEQDQQELGLQPVEPVLVVEQVAFLDNGTPFEYSFSRHRYDLFRFSVYSIRR